MSKKSDDAIRDIGVGFDALIESIIGVGEIMKMAVMETEKLRDENAELRKRLESAGSAMPSEVKLS